VCSSFPGPTGRLAHQGFVLDHFTCISLMNAFFDQCTMVFVK
jgi:hypothetical protein